MAYPQNVWNRGPRNPSPALCRGYIERRGGHTIVALSVDFFGISEHSQALLPRGGTHTYHTYMASPVNMS